MESYIFRVDPKSRYVLILRTPTRYPREDVERLAEQIARWWDSGRAFVVVNLGPEEELRFERVPDGTEGEEDVVAPEMKRLGRYTNDA